MLCHVTRGKGARERVRRRITGNPTEIETLILKSSRVNSYASATVIILQNNN